MTYQDMASASHLLQESFNAVAALPMPVVAAVTGFALGGGCELALCADLRVVGERAKLGQPEVLLGVIPGLGGSQRLPRLIGPSRAKDMILTGRYVGAQEAKEFGLADRVVADDVVYDEALGTRAAVRRGCPAGPGRGQAGGQPGTRGGHHQPGARSNGWSSPGSSRPRTAGSGWSRSWPRAPARRPSPAAESTGASAGPAMSRGRSRRVHGRDGMGAYS